MLPRRITFLCLPGDILPIQAVPVHRVEVQAGVDEKGGGEGGVPVLEAEHHWGDPIGVLDVPVTVHSPVSAEELQAFRSVSAILLHGNLGEVSASVVSDTKIQMRLGNRGEDLETFNMGTLYCVCERIAATIIPDIPVQPRPILSTQKQWLDCHNPQPSVEQ